MNVYILKGRSDSGKSKWAGEQENAIIVTRFYIYDIVQASLHAMQAGKDIIFDIPWNPDRESVVKRCFKGYGEVTVKEFLLPHEQGDNKTIENEHQ